MKGIIFDIKRFAVHDGPGIRTTIFLKGCPLGCWWCHNPESIAYAPVCVPKSVRLGDKTYVENETVGKAKTVDELIIEIEKERVFMEESGGGVTFSGGEPLLQHHFLIEALKRCQSAGIHTAVDTSAFSSWEILKEVATYTDLFLLDLKLMNDKLHRKYTGVSNSLILENIQKLVERGNNLRIRIPLIPGITDTGLNIKASIQFLKNIEGKLSGIDLLPYHEIANHKYERFGIENRTVNIEPIDDAKLRTIKDQFEQAGFITKIGG